jgi:hypothetical protein
MLALVHTTATGAITTGATCDKTGSSNTDITLKWNSYASEWGLYEIDGCTGVSPKLQLSAGLTYTFIQTDASNWYHPVGFSYIAGGAHTECKDADGVAGECPELGGVSEASGHSGTASILQYYVNDVAVTDDESGFGLDGYEPLFFNSQDWWGEQTFKVTLEIPSDVSYTRVYYFCHIHSGMSAEIEFIGSTASSQTTLDAESLGGETEASALAIYDDILSADQPTISSFDETCGTHGSSEYDPSTNTECANKHFLCGVTTSTFDECLQAVDCEMHYKMAVSVPSTSTSKFATFARQMIAHHQNAVAMSKVLQMHMTDSDFPAAGTEDQDYEWAEGLIRGIINIQNAQIQQMQGWLDANPTLAGTSELCYDTYGDPAEAASAAPVIAGVGAALAFVGIVVGLVCGKLAFGKAKAAPSA